MAKKKVVFVCSANTCRSVICQAILNDIYPNDYEASSAGLAAFGGCQIDDLAKSMLKGKVKSIDFLFHKSRFLTEEIVKENDIIVAVNGKYYFLMKDLFPEYIDKITCLPHDMSMPYYFDDIEYFNQVKEDIIELEKEQWKLNLKSSNPNT